MDSEKRISNLEKKVKILRAFYIKVFVVSLLSVIVFFGSVVGISYLYIKGKYGSIIEKQMAQIQVYQKKLEDVKKVINEAEKFLLSFQKDMDKIKDTKKQIETTLQDKGKLIDKLKKL